MVLLFLDLVWAYSKCVFLLEVRIGRGKVSCTLVYIVLQSITVANARLHCVCVRVHACEARETEQKDKRTVK